MSTDRVVLGVDIGGTKVAAGLVDSQGNILFKTRVPMKTNGSASEAMDCVHAAIRAGLEAECATPVSAIGVVSPGPLALPSGVVIETPNMPCWHNFPLGDIVRETYGFDTRIDNDANAAGLAEALWGAGAGCSSVLYATIGTGVGTAVIFDGRIFYGRTGTAPEGGHMTIDFHAPCLCACGKRGCVEALASGPAIARRCRERFDAVSRGTVLDSLCGGDPQRITTEMIAQAWHAGDPLASTILRETADLFAIWFGNLVDILEPDVIVVGGGVGRLISEWFAYIRERIPSWSINPRCLEIPLKLAHYESDTGIAGAAALCYTEPAQIRAGTPSSVRGQSGAGGIAHSHSCCPR